jgi:opacity protein-like surface antigen
MNRGRSVTKKLGLGVLTWCVLWGAPGLSFSQGLTVDERLERLEQKTLSSSPGATQETGNMVFFRGGWAGLVNDRSNEVFTDVFEFSGSNNQNTGYYVGAGLDLVLTKNLWGMMTNTWALGEIGVEFKRFDSKNVTQAVPSTCGAAIPSSGCTVETNKKVQITMLTVNVAPKIMFMEGSRLRPWIIPVGLDFHVISPPSNDTTVLDIGVQFAVGAQYRIWRGLHLGVDGRFHLATGQTDTTNNFGTAGAYVGIAF